MQSMLHGRSYGVLNVVYTYQNLGEIAMVSSIKEYQIQAGVARWEIFKQYLAISQVGHKILLLLLTSLQVLAALFLKQAGASTHV